MTFEYKELSEDQRNQIVKGTLLQAEADHFRAELDKERAEANGNDEIVEQLDGNITKLEADISVLSDKVSE